MEVCSLTYSSKAAGPLEDGAIERMLYGAQVNNALDGITGFLMYDGRSFVQVLEGTQPAIEDVMERITGDPRHCDVVVTDQRTIKQRAFPDWTMGFLRLDGTTGNAEAVERALRRDTPAPVRDLLLTMSAMMKQPS